MRTIRNNKGFTLLEILIVLIILGVIAGLAIPAFSNQIEKGRAQEAVTNLALIKQSISRWQAVNNPAGFPGAFVLTNGGCNTGAQPIDFDPECSTSGTLSFSYQIDGAGQGTATRLNNNSAQADCVGDTIVLPYLANKPTGNGCYAGL